MDGDAGVTLPGEAGRYAENSEASARMARADDVAGATPAEAGAAVPTANSGVTVGMVPEDDGAAPLANVPGIRWDSPAAPAAPIAADVEAELVRLVALDPIAYDQSRVDAAAALGIRVSTLDEQVQARRPMPEAAAGRGVSLPQPDPWPSPVTGAELLDGLTAAIKRHVILRPAEAEAVALWVLHTWVFERFQHTPRLSITSPAKRCGKSTLLDVLNATCRKPLKADSISAAGTFRIVEALAPLTLLLDEADGFLAENDELRSILNSGFERSGRAIRTVEINGQWQPVQFKTFAPVALAGIGKLPDTLEDRAVPVALQRKGAAEVADKLRAPGARDALAELASKAARWSMDRGWALSLDPSIPEAMGDREGDISVPLLSIATDAGGAWPARGRAALLDLFGKREAEGGTAEAGALLLADLRDLFQNKSRDRLTSAAILEALAGMEERPWPEWKQGKPMTAVQLARALKPFGVRPETIRFDADVLAKGYMSESFAAAWAGYLPAHQAPIDRSDRGPVAGANPPVSTPDTLSPSKPSSSSRNAVTSLASQEKMESRPVTRQEGVTDRKGQKHQQNQSCYGVTDQAGGERKERGVAGARRDAVADRRPPATEAIETVL